MEELRRRYDLMTHSQKRIAEYIVEHAEAVAFSTAEQVAAQLDVNPSTVVRFAFRLGLNGFPDLQQRIRQVVRSQLSRANENATDVKYPKQLEGTSYGASLVHDARNVQRTLTGLSSADLDKSVSIIERSRNVYVSGGRSSYPVAHYFSLILDRLKPNVILLGSETGMSNSRLAEMSADDCVVAFTFPRYAAITYRIARLANEMKASVIAITDTPISAVGQCADVVLLAASAGTGLHSSLVAPMAVANAILSGIVVAKGDQGLERYARFDRLMAKWNSVLLKDEEEPD